MSTVTLTIGPKSYAIAVADGQEAHITQLGAMIADKYAQLGSARAPLEAQNLLFAALFLADELAEAKKRLPGGPAPVDETPALRAEIARLQDELAAARKAAAAPRPAATAAPQADLFGGPDLTEALAERLEDLAARTEDSAAALEALVASA